MNDTFSGYLHEVESGAHVSFYSLAPGPHSPSTVSVETESRAVSETALPEPNGAAALDDAELPRALNPHAKEFQPQWGAQCPAAEETAAPGDAAAAPPAFMMGAGPIPLTVFPFAAMPGPNGFYPDLSGARALEGENMLWAPQPAQCISPAATTAKRLPSQSTLYSAIIEEYSELCKAKDYHMVVVHNLEPSTTFKDLHEIFYPMGAHEVKMLSPRHSPVPNRGAGVVFFSSKAFAEVAVEKIDYFVPKGQHLPLHVRYCYPDVTETSEEEAASKTQHLQMTTGTTTMPGIAPFSVSPAASAVKSCWASDGSVMSSRQPSVMSAGVFGKETLPCCPLKGVALDRVYDEMWHFASKDSHNGLRYIVAVHGLPHQFADSVIASQFMMPGSEGYTMWPPSECEFNATPLQCAGASALVWYTNETAARTAVALCNMKPQTGRLQKLEAVYIDGPTYAVDASREMEDMEELRKYDEIDNFFLRKHCDPKTHLLSVHNLPPKTEKRVLNSFFSLHGALDVELYHFTISIAGRECTSGVVFFANELSARTAAEKIESAMQLYGKNKLVVRYLAKKDSSPSSGSEVSLEQQRKQELLQVQKFQQEEQRARDRFVPSDPLLLAVSNELYKSAVDAEELAEKMFNFITRSEASEDAENNLSSVIVDALTSMRHHSVTLSTPLADALSSLHDRLGIQRKGGKEAASNAGQDASDSNRNIKFMEAIARALLGLFMDNAKPVVSRKVASVQCGYLFQYSYLTKSPYELAVKLLERDKDSLRSAFEYKRNEHESLNSTRPVAAVISVQEEEEHKPWLVLVDCIEEMITSWRQKKKSRAKKDPFRRVYDQLLAEIAPPGAARGGGRNSLNTSARPTPRRVIARVTPGSTCSLGERSTPGLSHASPSLPRASLRSGAVSHDVSLESHGGEAIAAARLEALLAQANMQQVPVHEVTRQFQQHQQNASPQQQQPSLRVGGWNLSSVYTHADLMQRTVFITKLPRSLRHAQFRRLLLHFGEFNKVRLYPNDSHTATLSNLLPSGDSTRMWRSFVEFAEPSSAKAMIEYFRNAASNVDPFDFLRDTQKWSRDSHFTPADIHSLLSARASPARNPIYGQVSLDATLRCSPQQPRLVVREKECLFGIAGGEMTIDTDPDSSTSAETVSAASLFAAPNLSSAQAGAKPQSAEDFSQSACRSGEALDSEMDILRIVDKILSPDSMFAEVRDLPPDSETPPQPMIVSQDSEGNGTSSLRGHAFDFYFSSGVDPENTFGHEDMHICVKPFFDDEDDEI